MFCRNCGQNIPDDATVCEVCGTPVENDEVIGQADSVSYSDNSVQGGAPKSKVVAGILGILLGSLGIHNFYLGYTTKGIIQIVLTVAGFLTCGITSAASAVWGLVEGILILVGNINKDANGNPLGN